MAELKLVNMFILLTLLILQLTFGTSYIDDPGMDQWAAVTAEKLRPYT
jgi:hypothetical protein